MCVVVTPFMVCQIHSSRRTPRYRGNPSIHPTSDFLRQFLLLGGFLAVFAGGCLGGTHRFVNRLPMCLLTFLGLSIGVHVSFVEVL